MKPLQRIAERVNRYGDVNDPVTPHPLLTLAEFFEGNETIGSIGCNLVPTPMPSEFYELLKAIAARADVADVRVEVTAFDDPKWPFSDVVWILTSATPQDVLGWFGDTMQPDECLAGWPERTAIEECPVPPDMQPVACVWD